MWTSSMIFLYVPSGVHTGLVKVTTGGQTSNGLPFIVTPGTYSGSCPANPPSQLTIVSASLPSATVGQAYNVTLQANGGISPYTWSITSGTLPSGLSLSASGDITGTPTAASGPVNITVKVLDHSATVQSATRQLSITVDALNPTSGQIYSYTASFDGVGNVTAYNDSVMGNWAFGYDTLNRLSAATISSGPYSDDSICWSYDSFGNRTDEQLVSGGGFTNSIGAPCQTAAGTTPLFDMKEYYTVDGTPTGADNGKNQATGTSAGAYTYDAAGNVTSGSGHQYLYDAEGSICAVQGDPNTGYLYNAEGRRIAKGTITSWSCDPSVNGFQLTESYALGQGGEQMSMFNGSGQWQRSNVYGAGRLLATYDASGLHFHITDPLGTRRVQVSGNSATAGIPELDYQSLPFGDMPQTVPDPNALSAANDATPLHFTGKARDTESGNDYFGARYYASAMGRWMSPDPSNLGVDIYLPQTWNRYNYAVNNPLSVADSNGMWPYYIHNKIIDESFPGMSKQDLQGLKKASWDMDFAPGQQDPRNAYQHGMSNGSDDVGGSPGTLEEEARQDADNFISQQVATAQQAQADWEAQGHSGIAPAALTAFGNALHTTTDRTSPSHQGEQPWANKPAWSKETRTHVQGELSINAAQMAASQRAAQNLFRRTFGNEFDWMFFKNPCARTSATDSNGNTTGWSGCQ